MACPTPRLGLITTVSPGATSAASPDGPNTAVTASCTIVATSAASGVLSRCTIATTGLGSGAGGREMVTSTVVAPLARLETTNGSPMRRISSRSRGRMRIRFFIVTSLMHQFINPSL